jgi:hypothetical protein
MRIRGLTIPLLLLAGVTGCSSRTSNITVNWNFGGGSCSGAGVEQVHIAISGEVLPQDTFDCRSGLVTFTEFYDGSYAVTVQGLDSTGAVTWTGSAQTQVRGDTSVTVTLSPVSGQNAFNYFSWSFDPGVGPGPVPVCGPGQRLDSVAMYFDGDHTNGYVSGCGDGLGSNTVAGPYLTPGQHTVELVAFDSTENQTAFAQSDTVNVNFVTGGATNQVVTLHWNVGGLAVGYAEYLTAADYQNNRPVVCAGSGIADVVLDFISPGQTPTVQSIDVGSNCNSSVVLDNVYAGTVTPGGRAYGPGATNPPLLYIDNANIVPPQPSPVTVTAGRFWVQGDTSFNVYVPMFPH